MNAPRSPRVRRIVMLRGRAAALRAAHEAALVRIAPVRHRAGQLVEEARALKGSLTDYELAELRRAWSGV